MMASCVKEEIAHDNNDGSYRMVETSISLSVANDSNGRIGTKAVDDPEDFTST